MNNDNISEKWRGKVITATVSIERDDDTYHVTMLF